MATLSLCMIAKDEEGFIQNCLSSARAYVDEIIIIDTGSTDNTVKVAKEFDAKVLHRKWVNDFSASKNEAIKQARCDWIIVLDADEVIAEKDWKIIRKLITDADKTLGKGKQEIAAFILDQINYTDNKNFFGWRSVSTGNKFAKGAIGYFPNPLIRLFRNGKNYKFRYKIHETIFDSIASKGGRIIRTNIPIHHYQFQKSKEFDKEKIKKYSKLMKEQLKLTPDVPKIHYQSALMYLSEGMHKEAENELNKVIELQPDFEMPYIHLADMRLGQDKKDEAIEFLQKAIEKQPKKETAYVKLGAIHTKAGRFQSAYDVMKKAFESDIRSPAIYNNLGFILEKSGKAEEAVKIYKSGVNRVKNSNDPYYYILMNKLVKLFVKMGKKKEAISILERAIELKPGNVEDFKEKLAKLKNKSK
ncbi:glycosyltransferase [Candidatus Woesearchaeota archaeon]|nr:glycosyltransferase [Candidatus Woesearchaeota archaeon]